ncbi:MAG: Gfo/Idh/MocA family oxidoreductase [Candidatus Eremiobacteraeota bacterium]|nr:Gfo/Idh/MocA family oxidoreductase [Candidatus Eremiobacteraeota bacterium]MCW5869104.1 Gfo/Idh/MocA family oxidoreductase [Candidatus Eremiobacteraeota bacterium]
MRVGVIGCGLIGSRRARVARDCLAWVCDPLPQAVEKLAGELSIRALSDWRRGLDEVEAIVVATPNGYALEIVTAGLERGLHVLMEKPMGIDLKQARQLAELAAASSGILKIGFNHRYHPSLLQAHELLPQLGPIFSMRARYGHGGRPGYEKEWRGDPALAGGGVLLDQGVHIVDLMGWFAGLPATAYAQCRTACWQIAPLEDNAFGILTYASGAMASLHVGWSQWKNLFSLEVFAQLGSLHIEGLGGSYGPESLRCYRRNLEGGVPEEQRWDYPGADSSWELEWGDFLRGCAGQPYWGTPQDGLVAMQTLHALYTSAASGQPAHV